MPARSKAKNKPTKARPAKKAKKAATSGMKTTSTFSPRLQGIHASLDSEIRRRFPQAEARFEYGVKGWRIQRPVHIEEWKGTIDPNFLHIYLAERKQGITLHFWNSYDPYHLKARNKDLTAAGFKVMVGCLQFSRKGDYPIEAVVPLLDAARASMDEES